jgi:uncharacterized membrane protein YgcG
MRELNISEVSQVYGGDAGEEQFEVLAKAAIDLAAEGGLDSGVAGKLFTSLDYAKLSANVNSLQFQYLENDYNTFVQVGEHAPPGQYFEIVHPENINWNAYSNGGQASASDAINAMFHDVVTNHHLAIDPNGNQAGAGGGGGGGGDGGYYADGGGNYGDGGGDSGGGDGTVTVGPIQS